MLRNLFGHDSPLMVFLSKLTDFIFFSIFCVLCCFGVVTVGASIASLYDATFRTFRCGDRLGWNRFWNVFRNNWKAGIVPSIVFLVCCGVLVKVMISLWNGAVGGSVSWLLFSAAAVLAVVVVGILSVLFPMLSRFENTTGALLRNTLMLSLANLPRTFVLGIINTVTLFLCVRLVVPLFILPSLAALLGSLLIEPMFKPYLNEDEDDSISENAAE